MFNQRLTLYCGWYKTDTLTSHFHFVVKGKDNPREALKRAFIKDFGFPPPDGDTLDAVSVLDGFDYDRNTFYKVDLRKIN